MYKSFFLLFLILGSFSSRAGLITANVSGSFSVTYFGLGTTYNYTAVGQIFFNNSSLADNVIGVTGGSLTLSGAGPDTSLTITPGEFSYDEASFFWDFGQGPFDVGFFPENPGYMLNNTGFSGTLADVFGNVPENGFFDAEGFGSADNNTTHLMSSFFLNGITIPSQDPPPEISEPNPLSIMVISILLMIFSRQKILNRSKKAYKHPIEMY